MQLVNLLVILTVICAASAASIRNYPSYGYLFQNFSRVPHCFHLPNNDECPADVVDYLVVDYDARLNIVNTGLVGAKLIINALDFFPGVSNVCREIVRAYACSNTFAVCKADPGRGISVQYDVEKTEAACHAVIANCPSTVQGIVKNCSFVQRDPSEYLQCTSLPDVPDSLCPKSNYKFEKPVAKRYPTAMKDLKNTVDALKPYLSESCLKYFTAVYCKLSQGPICSTDGKLRIFSVSRQGCAALMNRCLPGQAYFRSMCDIFPDADKSKRVPLPSTTGNLFGN